jgi:2-keto-4-pentenoate hydratase/2-oxohepta-3-ene-1,7-dioic acid hydratase in catechol pathway
MKIAAYRLDDAEHVGVVTEDGIIDIGARLGTGRLRDLLECDRLNEVRDLESAPADHAVAAVTFLPVVPNPRHFYCIGINYLDHLQEVQAAGISRPAPQHPSVFVRFPETLVAHDKASVGIAGVGATGHLTGIAFQKETGTKFQFVPYRGNAPARQAPRS